jgi:hypothetical protein
MAKKTQMGGRKGAGETRRRRPRPSGFSGLHAVRDALLNPRREKLRLIVTKNAADKLADAVAEA